MTPRAAAARLRRGSFRTRLAVALVGVGVAPVLLLGWTSFTSSRGEIERTLGASQARTAVELAHSCDRFVQDGVRAVKLAATYIPFAELRRDEIPAALAIPYRQIPAIDALVLLDRRGAAVAAPVRHADPASDPTLAGHDAVDDAALGRFAAHVPLEASLGAPAAVGPPYAAPGGAPRVAIAMRVGPREDRVLAAELSLRDVSRRLGDLADSGQVGLLVDARGEVVAGLPPEAALGPEERAFVAAGLTSGEPAARVVRRTDGRRWLTAIAPVPSLGWAILVAQPEAQAFGGAARVRRYTMLWAVLSLVVAGALAAVLARSLSEPVSGLCAAARALREGRYGERVAAAGGDELAALADAFNHMADEVQRRDDEIRGWNAELQRRVDAQMSELRVAHEQIARTRRLAALASMGAGFAHGVNNAMTSVVGLVTLARTRAAGTEEVAQLLDTALDEATRVTRIVKEVRDLAESERRSAGARFPLERTVRSAIEQRGAALAARGIALRAEIPDALPPVQGTPDQIERVVLELLDNAVASMAQGGTLGVALSNIEGQAVKLCVSDTGVGIPPEDRERIFDPFFTTRATAGAGLGLSVAHGIVEAHHGRIHVDSEPGKGSRFTVVLPAAAPEAHLA